MQKVKVRYYYNPVTKRFHNSILYARNWAINNMLTDGKSDSKLHRLKAGHWNRLYSDEWCIAHPDIVSCWLDMIPTYTRSMLEVRFHMLMYRLVKRTAVALM